jgi:hypothetical protein
MNWKELLRPIPICRGPGSHWPQEYKEMAELEIARLFNLNPLTQIKTPAKIPTMDIFDEFLYQELNDLQRVRWNDAYSDLTLKTKDFIKKRNKFRSFIKGKDTEAVLDKENQKLYLEMTQAHDLMTAALFHRGAVVEALLNEYLKTLESEQD